MARQLRHYANALRTASGMLKPIDVRLDGMHLADELLEEWASLV